MAYFYEQLSTLRTAVVGPRWSLLVGPTLLSGVGDLRDQRQYLSIDIPLAKWADMAVADMSAAVDYIRLGHAVDPEIDRSSSKLIDANATIGVAEIIEKMPGSAGLSL